MTILAKYPGTCTECHGKIRRGDSIEWTKGRGAKHTTCAKPTQDNPAAMRAPCWTCKAPDGKFRAHGAAAPVLCDACHATCKDCTRKCEHCGGWTEKDWQRDTQRCLHCCPTCHGPIALRHARKGYQCDNCADSEEGRLGAYAS